MKLKDMDYDAKNGSRTNLDFLTQNTASVVFHVTDEQPKASYLSKGGWSQ